jgi:hypothetical protein
MPAGRPAIPAKLQRAVLVEAGHRCAIPTCRSTPTVFAHITPWAKVQEHTFDNLIALCPTCHARFDNDQIDRLSMLQYKANLGLLNSRYGDTERRALDYFALHEEADELELPGGMNVLLMYLIQDGFLEHGETFRSCGTANGLFDFDITVLQTYRITAAGRDFVKRWSTAKALP